MQMCEEVNVGKYRAQIFQFMDTFYLFHYQPGVESCLFIITSSLFTFSSFSLTVFVRFILLTILVIIIHGTDFRLLFTLHQVFTPYSVIFPDIFINFLLFSLIFISDLITTSS